MGYKKKEGWFVSDYDGKRMFYRAWIAKKFSKKKCMVVEHGIGEHSARYQNFADGIVGSGYSIFMMDKRGHGKSEGKLGEAPDMDSCLTDMNSFFSFLEKEHGVVRPVLLGHSLGALLSVYFTLSGENAKKIRLLIVNASPMSFNMTLVIWLKKFIGTIIAVFYKKFQAHIGLAPEHISHDPVEVKKYAEDPLVHDILRITFANDIIEKTKWCMENAHSMKIPVLLTHGGGDKLSDKKGTQDLYKVCGSSDKSIIIYDGMYHEIYNEVDNQKVFDDLIGWVSRRS